MKTAVEWLYEQMPKKIQPHYKRQLEQAKEMENKRLIDFAQWYSGMDRDKVVRAYERYQKETFKQEQ
jgi:hypothetical protein